VQDLPSGTVTLLFTDIEGSTRLVEELGDAYAEVLAEHHRVLRDAFSRRGGVEVDTAGDGFFYAFTGAGDAVAAAGEAQDALAGGRVRVRMGVHTGEPLVTGEGYVGVDVHRAARIMSAGHGGQVLVSQTTQQLLDDAAELRDLGDHRLKDLGDHRLKDLGAPQRLYQLGDGAFPPLKTLYRTNLPVQPTPIVGRERELQEAGALVRANRLLTLTGPGGSGKTRLALQLAAEAAEEFPDGVFWVPLQALRDPALVEGAIGAVIDADDGLADHIGSKRLLVLLDNFEQIVEAAPTVSSLLAGTPNAKVLVTSREPLQIESEQRYPVEPLPDTDAVALFAERAAAVEHGFEVSEAVGEICRRLDGLPLAIELAAARVALLSADDLLQRLDQRLPLLASRSRDAPERQRTLRATIEWSYELLEPEEQELFRTLGVFRGSFTVEAAEAICGADLDVLESLVVKSLVRRWENGRLGMLDTIREYALELLDSAPDDAAVYLRHAEFFLAVARGANLDASYVRPGGQRLDLAMPDVDNFRAALAWTIDSGPITLGFQLAVALEQLWVVVDPTEGARWFERLFLHPEAESLPPTLRAGALRAQGSSLHIAGRPDLAEEVWNQSLAIYDHLDDEAGQATLLHRLGISAMLRGELVQARGRVAKSDEIHRRTNYTFGRAETTGTLGAIAREAGEMEAAHELVRESASLAREAEVPWWESGALAELACLSLNAGLIDEGETHARASLAIAEQLRDRPGRIFGIGILARVAAERGDSSRAGTLWAVVENEQVAAPMGGWLRHREEAAVRVAEAGGPDFDRGYAEGRKLTLDDAVSLALER
jgi:predicted ATPase/class 3 adenylate cyclase